MVEVEAEEAVVVVVVVATTAAGIAMVEAELATVATGREGSLPLCTTHAYKVIYLSVVCTVRYYITHGLWCNNCVVYNLFQTVECSEK